MENDIYIELARNQVSSSKLVNLLTEQVKRLGIQSENMGRIVKLQYDRVGVLEGRVKELELKLGVMGN